MAIYRLKRFGSSAAEDRREKRKVMDPKSIARDAAIGGTAGLIAGALTTSPDSDTFVNKDQIHKRAVKTAIAGAVGVTTLGMGRRAVGNALKVEKSKSYSTDTSSMDPTDEEFLRMTPKEKRELVDMYDKEYHRDSIRRAIKGGLLGTSLGMITGSPVKAAVGGLLGATAGSHLVNDRSEYYRTVQEKFDLDKEKSNKDQKSFSIGGDVAFAAGMGAISGAASGAMCGLVHGSLADREKGKTRDDRITKSVKRGILIGPLAGAAAGAGLGFMLHDR